jgi:hypothetical protein
VDKGQLLGCFGAMYYVGKNGQQTGPFTLDQVKAKYATGEILPTDLMWKEGTADWKAASTFSELAAPAPAPAPAATPSPSFGGPASTPVSTTVLPPSASIPGAMNTGYPLSGAMGPKQNPMAITGMVLGIVSIVMVCCCYGFPFNIAGIVFSIIGLNQIKKDPINQLGKPLALTGLILSILSIVIGIALFALGMTMNWEEIQQKINEAQQQQQRSN